MEKVSKEEFEIFRADVEQGFKTLTSVLDKFAQVLGTTSGSVLNLTQAQEGTHEAVLTLAQTLETQNTLLREIHDYLLIGDKGLEEPPILLSTTE